jgi:hypothetical protein
MESELAACRHEYVRIYQRKLKGLERRLVATKAWLPVGFKQADFSHLGEGSYCFCSKCRARLYPKRSQAEKAQARIDLAASKEAKAEALLEAQEAAEAAEMIESTDESGSSSVSIHVEEMEVESVDLADLEDSSLSLPDEKDCTIASDE